MKIRTQIDITVALLGALLLVICCLMINTHLKIKQLQKQGDLAAKIEETAGHIAYLTNEYLIYHERQHLRRWESEYNAISVSLAQLRVESPDEKALLDHIKANYRRVREVFNDTVAILGNSSLASTSPAYGALIRTLWSRMGVQNQEMDLAAARLVRLINDEVDQLNKTNIILLVCLLGSLALYFFVNNYLIYARILKSIAHLQAGTKVIGSGDLAFSIAVDRDDEIGELCGAFNEMTGQLSGTYRRLEGEIAERTRVELELRRAKDELEARVQERTRELTGALQELQVETEERIQAVQELRKNEQMLIQQSRLAAMGEMLVNISHQWRQPLNVLGLKIQELGLSYQYGAFSEQLLNDSIATAMEIIQGMSQTINDFQSFLTPSQEKTPFSVNQAIVKTVGLIAENFKHKGIAVDIDCTGDPQINGHPNEYGQVLFNLLMNAKYTFLERGVTGARITVRSWVEEGRAVVTVSDNAGGIGEDILQKIFDAYFTTRELGKGSGVGLFISKTIIEKNMGGRLSARNVRDGAEFRIEV